MARRRKIRKVLCIVAPKVGIVTGTCGDTKLSLRKRLKERAANGSAFPKERITSVPVELVRKRFPGIRL